MDYLKGLLDNRILIAALVGWVTAQIAKTVVYLIINRTFDPERLVGSGGMPSSHAATVCALTTAAAKGYGTGSFQFAISFIFAAVVLYDARGVRLETGKQAVTIRAIVDFLKEGTAIELPDLNLKELVGHTPFQVLIGSLLGILIGILLG